MSEQALQGVLLTPRSAGPGPPPPPPNEDSPPCSGQLRTPAATPSAHVKGADPSPSFGQMACLGQPRGLVGGVSYTCEHTWGFAGVDQALRLGLALWAKPGATCCPAVCPPHWAPAAQAQTSCWQGALTRHQVGPGWHCPPLNPLHRLSFFPPLGCSSGQGEEGRSDA